MINKLLYRTISAGLLLASTITYASMCNLERDTVDNFKCDGSATLAESTVRGKTSIQGSLDAKNVNLHAIDVAGTTNLKESVIRGDASIIGAFSAKRATFTGTLNVNSDQSVLDSSIVRQLFTVQGSAKPVIELRCGTRIKDGIVFKGVAGIVRKSDSSTIGGQVINGKIESISDTNCSSRSRNNDTDDDRYDHDDRD